MDIVFQIVLTVLWLFLLTLIARVVIDLLQVFARDFRPSGLVLVLFEAVYTVTDPPHGDSPDRSRRRSARRRRRPSRS